MVVCSLQLKAIFITLGNKGKSEVIVKPGCHKTAKAPAGTRALPIN